MVYSSVLNTCYPDNQSSDRPRREKLFRGNLEVRERKKNYFGRCLLSFLISCRLCRNPAVNSAIGKSAPFSQSPHFLHFGNIFKMIPKCETKNWHQDFWSMAAIPLQYNWNTMQYDAVRSFFSREVLLGFLRGIASPRENAKLCILFQCTPSSPPHSSK